MTEKELQAIETELKERGYEKWVVGLTSNESWGWFKTFGEGDNAWQVEFRVWEYSKYQDYGVPVGLDVWTAPSNGWHNGMECSWMPIADINAFERMAAEFNQLVRKYVCEG